MAAEDVAATRFSGWVAITAEAHDWHVCDFNHVNPTKAIGPELLMVRPGERLVVKVKTVDSARKGLTENQEATRAVFEAAGFEYHFWTPRDTALALERLSAEKRRPSRTARKSSEKTPERDIR